MTSISNDTQEYTKVRLSRDSAIDVIRGFCIASMVSAHLAGATMLADMFHVFPKFDGASGFVLLSGLVLGMVQRRRIASNGMRAVQRKSGRRLLVIYVLQLTITVVGLLAVYNGWLHGNFPTAGGLGIVELGLGSVSMILAPPGGDVLRLYVFLILIAMGGYFLLNRGKWFVLLGFSALLNLLAQVFPLFTSFSPLDGQARSAGWAGWQLLFVSALIIGWYWSQLQIREWLNSHTVRVFLSSVAVVVCAALTSYLVSPEIDDALFNKYTFPLGRIIVAYAVIAALYVVIARLLTRFPNLWVRPLTMIGQRSLDSYFIQAIVVVGAFGFSTMRSDSITSIVIAVSTLALCWAWAEFRSHKFMRISR